MMMIRVWIPMMTIAAKHPMQTLAFHATRRRYFPLEPLYTSEDAARTLTQLQPVRPNPAPGRATIGYSLVKQGNVDLAIFSVDGRLVKSLARGTQDAGSYRITWDGVDDRGSVAKSGVYFVRFHAPGVQQTRVLNLVR